MPPAEMRFQGRFDSAIIEAGSVTRFTIIFAVLSWTILALRNRAYKIFCIDFAKNERPVTGYA